MTELPGVDGFRIVSELGSGSISTVYRAIEEPLGRTVALKMLRATIPPSSPLATQLEREARVLSELCHPNVGLLYAFARTDARMYLVLEFVDGFSLAALLKKGTTVSADCVAAIGAAVARGLAHAHDRGVVHRDVKPTNILLSRRGDVKLFDFGIAQRSSLEEPTSQSPIRLEDLAAFGTPAYMSPEQILGEHVDGRSDIFSLGVVLYQLLCGARPFERSDDSDRKAVAHRIRREPPIPLHRRAPHVPLALGRVITRAIEKLPDDRFASAHAMADRLDELVTSRTGIRSEALVVRALVHAGLATPDERGGVAAPKRRERLSLRSTVVGLGALGVAAVAGGTALQVSAPREGQSAGVQPLELAPVSRGYLRVLATPWAEVSLDGQRVDTTPFAQPIPLSPGTHYATLVHPSAPVEKRSVVISAGETRTLDVVMAVPDLPPKDEVESNPPRADREAP